jgi:hypothetical protein
MTRYVANEAERLPPILRPCSVIIRNCKGPPGLFIEEQAVIRKVLHLSLQILRPQTETGSIATLANGVDMRQLTVARGDCHVPISLIFVNRFLDFSMPHLEFQQRSSARASALPKAFRSLYLTLAILMDLISGHISSTFALID